MHTFAIKEANLYFSIYLKSKQVQFLFKALRVHYNHCMLLCIEHGIYFEVKHIISQNRKVA